MKRSPFLFIVLCLIVVGALFFRYLSPESSSRIMRAAENVQQVTTNAVAKAVASVTARQEAPRSNEELRDEEKRLAKLAAEQQVETKATLAEIEQEDAPQQLAANENREIDQAMERANTLLQNAMQAAKEAREQIAIAQRELDALSQTRARLNPNALIKQKTPKQSPDKTETQKTTDITPHAPSSPLEKLLAENTIRFDWTKSELSDDAIAKIAAVAEAMAQNPDRSLRVIGHTDSNGKEELNEWLGLIRARRVRTQLISLGMDAKRIAVSSRGSKDPIETNETPMGRWKNRRVEFAISEK